MKQVTCKGDGSQCCILIFYAMLETIFWNGEQVELYTDNYTNGYWFVAMILL